MLLTSLALVVTPAISQEQSASRAVILHEVTMEGPVTSTSWSASSDDRPLLGVHLTQDSEGAVIQTVIEGSPAAKAGLEAGDRILKVGKKKVKDTEGLIEAIAKREPGDQVTIRVMRGKERVTLKATLAQADVLANEGEVLNDDRVSPYEDDENEDVDYWESEDGSERRLEIHIEGDRVPEGRIREIMQEHGIDLRHMDFGSESGEHEIEIVIDSEDGEGPHVMHRVHDGVLYRVDGEEHGGPDDQYGGDDRRRMDDDRTPGRARGQGGARGRQGRDRGRRRGGRRGDRGRVDERGGMNEGRTRERDDRGQPDWWSQRDDRGRGRMPEGERRGGWDEGRMRERDDRGEQGWWNQREGRQGDRGGARNQRDERVRGQRRDREGQEDFRGQRERDVLDEWPRRDRMRDARPSDRREENSDYSEMDIHERIQHLEEEHGRNQEDLHRHGEEMMRGFEEASREMEERSSEHIRNLHEERERVIGELHQQIEEVTRRFEEAFHEAEVGFEERSRHIEEERERRFEELHQREEEMGHRYDERIHELQERAEQTHD